MKRTLAILASLVIAGTAWGARTNSITLNPDSTVAKKVNHVSSTPITLPITVTDIEKASATLVVRNSSGTVIISTNAATVADDVYTFNLVAGQWTTNIFNSSKSIGDTEIFWGDIYPLAYGAPLPAIKFNVRYGANTGSESYVDPTQGTWIAGGTTSSVIATVDMGTGASISGSTLTLDEDLQDIAAIAPTDGLFLVGDGSDWVGESGATARTSMGLGGMAVIDDATSDNTLYGRSNGTWTAVSAGGGSGDLTAVQVSGGHLTVSSGTGPVPTVGLTTQAIAAVANTNTPKNGIIDTDTLSFDWDDSEVSDTLTIGSGGTVNKGALANAGTLSFDWDDSEITNTLTIGAASTIGAVNGASITNIIKTALANSGTLSFDWADSEVSDTLTIGAASTIGAVNGASITNLNGANIQTGTIDVLQLDAGVQTSLALADSAMQDLIDDTAPTLGGNLDADDKTLNNMGILYDGNGAGAGMNFSGSVFWDSGGNNWIDGEDRKLVGVGSVDILGWTATRLYVMNAAGQNIADNDVVSVDGSPANNEAGVWTANGMDGKSEAEFKSLFNMEAGTDYALPTALLSGIYTQSFATNISYNMGYKIAGQLTVTNTVTFDVADAQPLHPFNFIIYGTNTVTMDSNLTLFGSWTQAATNVLSFTPKETGKWFYTVATP